MDIPKETNDDEIIKYKRMVRKSFINGLAWLENNPNSTEEETNELIAIADKAATDARTYKDNKKYWIKHTYIHKLKEHQAYLDKGTDAQDEE